MTDPEFRMAEDPAQNERFFSSLDHVTLVANCCAAADLVKGQVARSEHNRLRAEVAIKHAARIEAHALNQFEAMERALKLLKTATDLKGRTNRRIRDEAVASVINALSQFVALGAPEALGELPDVYVVTIQADNYEGRTQ